MVQINIQYQCSIRQPAYEMLLSCNIFKASWSVFVLSSVNYCITLSENELVMWAVPCPYPFKRLLCNSVIPLELVLIKQTTLKQSNKHLPHRHHPSRKSRFHALDKTSQNQTIAKKYKYRISRHSSGLRFCMCGHIKFSPQMSWLVWYQLETKIYHEPELIDHLSFWSFM